MGRDSRDMWVTLASTLGHGTQKNCSKCGAAFHCGSERGGANCWCDNLPKLFPLAERDCLCPACFGDAIAQQQSQPKRPLVEGEDYYAEGKVIVFTASHHLRRGYCCGRGCRHCPYQ